MLTTFPTPRIEDTESLYKQLQPFHRPTGGKKPALPLPSSIDISTPNSTSYLDGDAATPGGSDMDEDRPKKRQRRASGLGQEADDDEMMGSEASPTKHGKKPSGKTSGKKERMPRTVVRSARGLVPMETEPDGSQHVGGHLPETVAQDGKGMKGAKGKEGVPDEDEDETPLAQKRPQLDEGERKRREMAKEKEKEREVEVLRNQRKEDVEVWEGVELVGCHSIYRSGHGADRSAETTSSSGSSRGSSRRDQTDSDGLSEPYTSRRHPSDRSQEPVPEAITQNA